LCVCFALWRWGNTKPWHELSGAVGLQAQLAGRKLFFLLKNLMEKVWMRFGWML
jgi:hypothetical protein